MKSAKNYYQTRHKELTTRDIDNVLPQGMLTAESAQAFTTTSSEAEGQPFFRVVEIWYRTDQANSHHDRRREEMGQGSPLRPPYPTERFYPYFYFAFYEVDGERHAQTWHGGLQASG